MKGMKKLLSILMVLTLVLSLGATAFAANVTVAEELSGHTFTAYQIFKGTQNDESGNKLGDVQWGSDIDAAKFVAALQALNAETFGGIDAANALGVAEALSKAVDDEALAKAIAEAAFDSLNPSASGTPITPPATELPNGYYLIKDTTENLNGNEAYNDVVLQVTEDVNIQYKTDVPTSEKKVKDVNDSDGNGQTGWQDAADWDIGDSVPFQITGTLPSNYADYDKYAITFHDEQSTGLTFDPESVVVTVNGTTVEKSMYKVNYNDDGTALEDGCTFEIVIGDLKTAAPGAAADAQVVVTYSSYLNDKAVIGNPGNPNKMTMDFSNNPHGDGTGTTPEDVVTVFTFELDVNKVTGGEEPLAGAGFTLYKENAAGEYEQIGQEVVVSENGEKFTAKFEGLDDGEYKLVETKVPAGYNQAPDILFTVTATHTEDDKGSNTQSVTGLQATVTEPSDWDGQITVTDTSSMGVLGTDIVNNEGPTLPETGGIGTTIFYIAGAVLVAGAVILLVTKKRVSGMEK